MIPRLPSETPTSPATRAFLHDLVARGFQGDVSTRTLDRLAVATDNSVYQVLPDAVVHPRNRADLQRVLTVVGSKKHTAVSLLPRGGGTGTNGQSLGVGVVVDLSRYMARILELDLNRGWVRVEPGVVLDDLNRYLRPHGVFFAPTLSPSSRATLGGMIGTNASGKGSRIYGRTVDHVLGLDVVLVGGSSLRCEELPTERAQRLATVPDRSGDIYRTVLLQVRTNAREIERVWPKIPRTLTGYDLAHVLGEDGKTCNLIPLLCGSEGTLGLVAEAKLRVLPLPKHARLLAIRYGDFQHALGAARRLLEFDPSAIETIDRRIITLAQNDPSWQKVAHLIEPENLEGLNLVEFVGDDRALLDARVDQLSQRLTAERGTKEGALGYVLATTSQDQQSLWDLRGRGVGLLGALPGVRRPIPFVEDTAVPPEHLAQYVKEFRALLDEAGLTYGMFGHVDVGCLHVRPALDLRDPADEQQLRRLSDAVVALVKRYGGVLWGEHGKGFRSEYSPEFFGPVIYRALCHIKAAFDPYGQLNPGKLAVPEGLDRRLASIDSPSRGSFDRQIPAHAARHFDVAIYCNGNAQCHSTDPGVVMCPSSKARRDRVHSPKGRATVLREWLRQLGLRGVDAATELHPGSEALPYTTLPWFPTMDTLVDREERRFVRDGQPDFSRDAKEALEGCLSCKACATECPIRVDIPRMKSEFLALYHQRYPRPVRDYAVGALEHLLPLLARMAPAANALQNSPLLRDSLSKWLGLVDIPPIARPPLGNRLGERPGPLSQAQLCQRIAQLNDEQRRRTVVLVQDAFTTFYEPDLVVDVYDLLRALSFNPLLLKYHPSGKALHIKGFLRAFARVCTHTADALLAVASTGVELIGIEPAVTLMYRDEYRHALGGAQVVPRVRLLVEWLDEHRHAIAELAGQAHGRGDRAPASHRDAPLYTLLAHCTEKTAHPASQEAWHRVFEAASQTLEVARLGCCGMGGVFGHEQRHTAESKAIFEQGWAARIDQAKPNERLLATGYSCRSQVKRQRNLTLSHPAQALLAILRGTPGSPPQH